MCRSMRCKTMFAFAYPSVCVCVKQGYMLSTKIDNTENLKVGGREAGV